MLSLNSFFFFFSAEKKRGPIDKFIIIHLCIILEFDLAPFLFLSFNRLRHFDMDGRFDVSYYSLPSRLSTLDSLSLSILPLFFFLLYSLIFVVAVLIMDFFYNINLITRRSKYINRILQLK